jgi:hypothetical protein
MLKSGLTDCSHISISWSAINRLITWRLHHVALGRRHAVRPSRSDDNYLCGVDARLNSVLEEPA